MGINKNRSKDLFLVFLKAFFLIVGLNIFLTTVLKGTKLEFKRNNLESEINLNIKKLKYD